MAKHIMKLIAGILPTLALGTTVAALALVTAAPAAAAEGQKQTNSAKLAKPLKEAQDDIKAKKFSEAIAKLKEAEGTAGKTPYDQHLINDMLTFCYIKTNAYADAAKVMEAEIDDGFTPQAEIPQKVRGLAEINYQLKNYDKAIDFGNRAIKGGFGDEQIRTLVGQAYYLKGDWKGTLKFEQGLVDNQVKAGETPKNESLQLILSSCVKMSDAGCETHALEQIVRYYPKPDYWYQLLYTVRQQTSGNDANTLQTYRLMSELDVLKNADDYTEMAQLALESGSPGEAQKVLQKGLDKNIFTDQRAKERNQRLLENAKKQAANDQASLPKQEKDAEAASTGQKSISVGLAYLGYGQYDKAIDELNKGITKGGLKDQNQARLLLGIAQLKGGHKDEAIKTFGSVKGDAALERLANLWTLHSKEGSSSTASQGKLNEHREPVARRRTGNRSNRVTAATG
jgi:tetratricopeptide (TPR) repeat protein